ncbi:RNA polymerase sigma factor, partial [Larkinella ripae]
MALSDQIAGHRKKILAYAKKLTGDEDDAEDLTQDAVIKALTNQDKFEEGTNLSAWLATITYHLFVTNYKRAKRFANPVDVADAEYLVSAPANVFDHLELEHAEAALSRVPEHQRRYIDYRRHGYKYEEIAEMERIPVGTVKNRIHLARHELDRQIKTTRQPMNLTIKRVDYQKIVDHLVSGLYHSSPENPVVLTIGELGRKAEASDLTVGYAVACLIEQGIIGRRKAEQGHNRFEYWRLKGLEALEGEQLREWVAVRMKQAAASRAPKPKRVVEQKISSPKIPGQSPVTATPAYGYFVNGSLQWLADGTS